MASSFGIGDLAFVSKLAWTMATALTQGRKSAPSELQELENQLYSLSTAFSALKSVYLDESIVNTPANDLPYTYPGTSLNGCQLRENLKAILASCEGTLKHLEKVLKQYGAIIEKSTGPQTPVKKWTAALMRDYKKISWTTEKGNLTSLRSQIMVHTNSLNLILAVMNSSQTTRIEEITNQHLEMTKEIYLWFTENVKGEMAKGADLVRQPPNVTEFTIHSITPSPTFEISVDLGKGNSQIICPRAALSENWEMAISKSNPGDSFPVFACHCNVSTETDPGEHYLAISVYELSPFSFPFGLLESPRAWTLSNTADTLHNSKVSIVIRKVALHYIPEFERTFVRALSEAKAEYMLSRGMSNMLTYVSSDTQQPHVLNIRGDIDMSREYLEAVTFNVGNRSYERQDIEDINLLHYRIIAPGTRSSFSDFKDSSPVCDYAEIVIFYNEAEVGGLGDISRNTILVKSGTSISLSKGSASVLTRGVMCLGYSQEVLSSSIPSADVEYQFAKVEAASHFYNQLESIRLELFVLSLQYPQRDENVVLHLETAQVHSQDIYITDAEIFVVCNSLGRFRLIILSRNRCTILSQILAEDFFTAEGSQPNFSSPTYLVQLEGNGERKVYHYEDGLSTLSFQSPQAGKMFELGCRALHGQSKKTSLAILPKQ